MPGFKYTSHEDPRLTFIADRPDLSPEEVKVRFGSMSASTQNTPTTTDDFRTMASDDLATTTQRQRTTTPGWRTTAAEIGGGTVGEMLAGPPGAAVGAGGARLIANVGAQRPAFGGVGKTALSAGLGSAASYPVRGAAGYLARKGTQQLTKVLPSFGSFMERISPGILEHSGKADEAIGQVGRNLSETEAGKFGQATAKTALDRFHQWSELAFRHTEELAGDQELVPTIHFQNTLEQLGGLPSLRGMTPEATAALDKARSGANLTFREARLLESAFGKATTVGGDVPVGGPARHLAGEFKSAVSRDLDEFLLGPADPALGPELNRVKQEYGAAKDVLNKTVMRTLVKKGARSEAVGQTIFKPGNLTNLEVLKKTMLPEQYQDLVASHLSSLWKQAHSGGRFNALQFGKSIEQLTQSKGGDMLAEMVPPEQYEALTQIAREALESGTRPPLAANRALSQGARAAITGGAAAAGTGAYYHGFGQQKQLSDYLPEIGGAGSLAMMLHPAGRAALARGIPQVLAQVPFNALRGTPIPFLRREDQ